jgi:hypothetical protein
VASVHVSREVTELVYAHVASSRCEPAASLLPISGRPAHAPSDADAVGDAAGLGVGSAALAELLGPGYGSGEGGLWPEGTGGAAPAATMRGPRLAANVLAVVRANAALERRPYVTPDDVRACWWACALHL